MPQLNLALIDDLLDVIVCGVLINDIRNMLEYFDDDLEPYMEVSLIR